MNKTKIYIVLLISTAVMLCGTGHAELNNDGQASEASDIYMAQQNGSSDTEVNFSTIPLNIIHPAEGAILPNVRSSFVYGSADPAGQLFINGSSVPVHSGGGFLAMVNYSTGSFTINAELKLPSTYYELKRVIYVTPLERPLPDFPVKIVYAKPGSDTIISRGDNVFVECGGSPGKKGFFRITGISGKYPLNENAPGSGIYRGVYKVKERDKLNNASVKLTLSGRGSDSYVAKGKVSTLREDSLWVVEVTADNAVVRAGPSLSEYDKAGYMLFPMKGTRFTVTGKIGNELKVYLNKTREGWIGVNDVLTVSNASPLPLITAGNIGVYQGVKNTAVSLSINQKLPFEIRSSLDQNFIDLSFFGAVSNTDWITYGSTQTIVKQVQWFQDDTETYRMRINLQNNSVWGYDAKFSEGSFIFELKTPPVAKSTCVLEGITVAVDAGHGPDKGSIGPTGLLEKDANWNIAVLIEKKLAEEKANVVMTRCRDEGAPLYVRPKRAIDNNTDILVSIHNNALPEGKNPFEKNGFGVYYFYPQSMILAREISRSFSDKIGKKSGAVVCLNDDGIYYGNLALARIPQMPSVLVECAYMIIPEEEALLKTEAFQEACADAVISGLKRYVEKMRGMK